MKRDMDVIRDILLTLESSDTARIGRKRIELEGVDPAIIDFHIELLKEAGFVDHQIVQPQYGSGYESRIRFDAGMRLTMDGYDFLESIKDVEVWEQTKVGIRKVGNAGLAVVWEIAKAYGKQVIKERLGLDI